METETEYEVVDIPVIGVFNKRTNELKNIVYKNDKTGTIEVCEVLPTKMEGMRVLFKNLMGK